MIVDQRTGALRRALAGLFIPIFAVLASKGVADEGKPSPSITLPLSDRQPHKGNPYITLKVNGVEGLFLIDTGMLTKENTISKAFAAKCGLKGGKGTVTFDDGKGNSLPLEPLTLDVVEWGGGDGCLGRAFYETVMMTLDSPAKQVTFERYPEKGKEGDRKDHEGKAVPFRYLGTTYRGPFIDAMVNGKKTLLIVDTGANWSSLNADVVKSYGLATKKEKGNYDIAHVKLAAGDLAIDDAAFASLTNAMLADMSRRSGENIAGIVGQNILGKYKVTFDYRNKRMIFAGAP